MPYEDSENDVNMSDEKTPRYVFKDGDHALVVDRRGRRYLVRLASQGSFHTHLGHFRHESLIGRPEGTWVTTSKDHRLLAVKPTMADFIREMPRIATIVYPKDLGAIIVYGDLFPGARVLEAGSGSGALTIALTRAVGTGGMVVSYDVREDMTARARQNVDAMMPDHSWLTFKNGDVYEGFEETELDRVVLDLPEPWQVVPHASTALVPGGIFLSFVPTVLQFHELTQALKGNRSFELIETMEVLMRPWEVAGRAVRPSHRMVGHTGFITTARKCSPRETPAPDEAEE